MRIALTKKLADAMGVVTPPAPLDEDPLFSWTANWTKVWDNRRIEDMLVLVNNATRFTVAIYQVKRNGLKNVAKLMKDAISNTLLSMNLNPELVSEYMRLAGDVEFSKNSSKQMASWVSKAGIQCAIRVGYEYSDIPKMFCDTVGIAANYTLVSMTGDDNMIHPYQEMIKTLSELTGKQPYQYRAFELLVTLDLEVYQAVRRLIVPASLTFSRFHKVLQIVYSWKSYHLYDFTILDGKQKPVASLVLDEDYLEYDEKALLMGEHTLSEYLPKHKHIRYTYDMGDNWTHEIELVRIIEEYGKESPYLLEASGQTPPEDVGGVGGFIHFRDIMLTPNHPEHQELKAWAGYWTAELSEWMSRPRVIQD